MSEVLPTDCSPRKTSLNLRSGLPLAVAVPALTSPALPCGLAGVVVVAVAVVAMRWAVANASLLAVDVVGQASEESDERR